MSFEHHSMVCQNSKTGALGLMMPPKLRHEADMRLWVFKLFRSEDRSAAEVPSRWQGVYNLIYPPAC